MTPPPVAPCSLLTARQVSEVLHVHVRVARWRSSCAFQGTKAHVFRTVVVSAQRLTAATRPTQHDPKYGQIVQLAGPGYTGQAQNDPSQTSGLAQSNAQIISGEVVVRLLVAYQTLGLRSVPQLREVATRLAAPALATVPAVRPLISWTRWTSRAETSMSITTGSSGKSASPGIAVRPLTPLSHPLPGTGRATSPDHDDRARLKEQPDNTDSRARHNRCVPKTRPFAVLAGDPDATLDVLALALAAEFRDVDIAGAMARLDILAAELTRAAEQTNGTPEAHALACGQVIGAAHGFVGDRDHYDDPGNSMLDLVLTRRRGLPILLSVVYVEVARRAGIEIAGVGLPGHFVVGHFGTDPPVLLDPFAGGGRVHTDATPELVRPWRAHEVAMRMLNNLVMAYDRRGDVGAAIKAARLRLALPAEASHREMLHAQLRAIQARLN